MHALLRRIMPDTPPVSAREKLRAASGACLGILATGLIGSAAVGFDPALPALVAPMGASAVLLFAVPASPLAQPWSILGGNMVAALVGVSTALLVPDPLIAAAVAIGLAIAVMMALRCLHPPSGAIALTAVIGGPAVEKLGYGFVLWPVLGNSLVLLLLAIVFNNLSGRRYPHRAQPTPGHGTSDPAPLQRIGFRSEDLDQVLKEYDQVLDIDRDDLEEILRRTELRSYRHRADGMTCHDIMSRDVVAVSPDTRLDSAHAIMRTRRLRALPVTNDAAEVIGIVTQSDFLEKADWTKGKPAIGLRQRMRLLMQGKTAPSGIVRDIMTAPVTTVRPTAALSDAIVLLAEQGLHHLPVVADNGKMVGIIAQSDVLVASLEATNKP